MRWAPDVADHDNVVAMTTLHPQPEPVRTLTALLKTKPIPNEMNIAILRDDSDERNSDDASSSSYPSGSFKKVDVHLGLHAPDLPRLARDFREDYRSLRSLFLTLTSEERGGWSTVSTPNGKKKKEGLTFDQVALRERVMDTTACLLMVCPDNASAWADRRRALLHAEGNAAGHMSMRKIKDIFIFELRFLNMLFTQHAKAPNAWAHRKWICRRIVSDKVSSDRGISTEDQWYLLQPWAQREIDLCTRVGEQFPNNYFAWGHRHYVISTLFDHWPHDGNKYLLDRTTSGSLRALLAGEVMLIEQWLLRHVSDHAAAHYGGEAMRLHLTHGLRSGADGHRKNAGTAFEWALALGEGVLTTARYMVKKHSSHEVIWVWRRLCGQLCIRVACGELGPENGIDSQAAADAINNFIQREICDVFKSIGNEDTSENGNTQLIDKTEQLHSRVHKMTFILWILDQLRRQKVLGRVENPCEIEKIGQAVKSILKGEDDIVYNTWRLA